jgi:hypothetical protein
MTLKFYLKQSNHLDSRNSADWPNGQMPSESHGVIVSIGPKLMADRLSAQKTSFLMTPVIVGALKSAASRQIEKPCV